MRLRIIIILISVCVYCNNAMGQKFSVKTNVLYGLGTLTPNASVETNIGSKWTINLSGAYNRWNVKTYLKKNNQKLAHWSISPEIRYWLKTSPVYNTSSHRAKRRNTIKKINVCYDGFYIGAYPFYGEYNISKKNIPFLFSKNSDKYRYQGNIIGAGISGGYAMPLSTHFNMEFGIGLGGGHMVYDKYEYQKHGKFIAHVRKTYWGVTKLQLTIAYLFL